MNERKIALFDIDNTIYNGHTLFSLSEYQYRSGIIKKQNIEELHKIYDLYKVGTINYEVGALRLLNCWANALKGLDYVKISENAEQFLNGSGDKFYHFTRPLINFLKQKEYDIYFITGATKFVAEIISKIYKINGFFSSEFYLDKGVFTGQVKNNLADDEEKRKIVKKITSQYNLENSFAFGDSETDIEMLKSVKFPVIINPTPNLKTIAEKHNWHITEPKKIEELVSTLLADKIQ